MSQSIDANPGQPNAENGAWISNLRFDVPASFAVALVALPLCLGIAVASGAPPIAGLISGIVGGIIVGFLSGSHTSVSGPAAGLTAVVVVALSEVDFSVFLVSVVLAGVIQIAFGVLKFGFIVAYFPTAVIRGLLAAIGLILIFKQVPHAFGIDTDPEGDMAFEQPDQENTLSEMFNLVSSIEPGAVIISCVCLAIILLWDNTRLKKLVLPSSLVAVVVGVLINLGLSEFAPSWALQAGHLVELPDFGGGSGFFGLFGATAAAAESETMATGVSIQGPDFMHAFGEPRQVAWIATELAIVASLESLLNIEAIDKLDPQKRHSPPNRELIAQGVGNMSAGFLGGLPVTSVVVRSSMNVTSGGRSKIAAILHGFILLGAIALIPKVLSMIPLAALAAILLVIGYKLTSFKIIKEFYNQGYTQFLPFIGTVLAIFFTDLMYGIAFGLAVGLFFVLRSNSQNPVTFRTESRPGDDVLKLKFAQQVTFLNRAYLLETLESLPAGSEVVLDATGTDYIDQDILALISAFKDEEAPVRNIRVNLIGFHNKSEIADQHDYVNVLTKEMQVALTPAGVLDILKKGNERFTAGARSERDLLRQVRLTETHQFPMAAILSCIDSRTTNELIFDLGLGDIFSVRVAGNVVSEDVIASLEYATKVAGSKLIVVVGHTNCGAVNSAIADVKLGRITGLLAKIKQAIEREKSTTDNRTPDNKEFVETVTKLNIELAIEQILEQSPIISELVENGEIAVVGGLYHLRSGEVEFLHGLDESETALDVA